MPNRIDQIFVSSTYRDLADHREVLRLALETSGYRFNGMEHFAAQDLPPLDVCLHSLDRCNNQVFPVVEMCPRCGRTLKDQSSLGPLAYVYALMVLIGILIWNLDFGPWGALLGFVVAINGVALLLYRAFFLPW